MAGESDLDDLELFFEFVATRQRSIRNRLVERHMGLAAHIAKRFSRPGVTDDDLRQVAMLGLVKAVDRFDPAYGVPFAAFAGSTIEGELKRHFRDLSWVVRVPRSAKELHLLVRRATDELVQKSGRSPSVDEIAEHLGIEREDVLRGLAASSAYHVGTLQAGGNDGDTETPLDRIDVLASEESGFDQAVDADLVSRLLAQLPEREQHIVRLRFYEQQSQEQIAAAVGVSQMQVSRLLRGSFEKLREWMEAEDSASPERVNICAEVCELAAQRVRFPVMSDPGSRLEISATATGWGVSGEIDAHTAPTLAAAMSELPSGVVTVDVAGVSFMDSSGLRVLIEAASRARDGGGDLVISNPTPGIARLIEISGLAGQLRVDD